MDDLISRQAAIRNVCEKECRMLKPCNAECGSIIALRELPSADAQPEKRTEKHAETHMRDLISRADVEQTVEDNILCYTHSDRPIDQDPDTETNGWTRCGNCGAEIRRADLYCSNCGKEVKRL